METNKNSEIRKDNDTFYIKTDKIGRINLTILFFKNGKRIEARSKELRFQRLPKGSPKFGGLFDGESMAYSNITRELTLQIDAFNKDEVDFSYLHKIKEFIVCTYSEGKMIENKSFSEKISEDQWTQLKMLNTGNKFYIENIIIMQLDNSLKNIGSMMLKIE